ncbi:uncharacterized protein JCM6883_005803 [Sporobolomyces salmoneus]|uniref:uncharacterized protein n=1 Tax=Sporobolomyces salmoneus TaxID=183962 RepID=UPI0031719B09
MHLPVTLATLLLPTLALSSSQLYLSPPLSSSSSSSSSTSKPLTLTAPQANAVLAHHLGVSSYVDLPLSSSREQGREWEQLLSVPPSRSSKFVILLECPSDTTCLSLVPSQFTQSSSRAIELPNLGENSYLSALSLHLYRLADSLGLKPDDNVHVKGLKEVVEKGLKGVVGWQGWVGKELASWIGYDQVDNRYRIQPEPTKAREEKVGILSELDFLDESGKQLARELENLVSISDSFVSSHGAELPKIVIVHLKGLRDIAKKHSTTSPTYKRASSLLHQTLSASIASYESLSSSLEEGDASTLLLTVQPAKKALLRKRQDWLHPFESPVSRYTSRTRSSPLQHQNLKRSVFAERAPEEEVQKEESGKKFVVPSSSTCFDSLEDLNNQTASCLGHGEGVKGISTKEGKGDCWVCRCRATVDEETGKKTNWAGEGCEKVDLSGSFSLLFFSSLGLILILGASVSLLYKIGTVELPGTLSAVGGTGGGHIKRD